MRCSDLPRGRGLRSGHGADAPFFHAPATAADTDLQPVVSRSVADLRLFGWGLRKLHCHNGARRLEEGLRTRPTLKNKSESPETRPP